MIIRFLGGFARTIHVISAFWVLILGFAIMADVLSRNLFSYPIRGTTEVIKNSVVAITFLQLPLAVASGSMLRTELVSDALGPHGRRALRTIGYVLGAALFTMIAVSAWGDAIYAWRIGEYEGEGALRVPTWPVRFVMIGTAILSAITYLSMIWLDWTGQLEQENAYPGILSFDAKASQVMTGERKH
ncbi:MAG: TRAP-type C4-dicarboxylate transport system, small permease component [Rhodobacteraceae bacterium HLUCCA12]|nr:MAG: TRAP-type C4-dicarboxylate transport system, small permease component [Rhodobacteraceae bacterium HLUCCA12]